jgi:eukaryotic-like serine/threonine-protein kinase
MGMRDLVVGDTVDQYEVTELLARSGMASIFKATDRESGEPVVLKVPHIQYESDVVFYERFMREEEIGRRLSHPNIVRSLAPASKSRMYLALEYVEGESLRARLRAKRPLATEEALHIACQLCTAVAYLHEQGVVHRDLKPENVLLVPPRGEVKLLDFGIALLGSARRVTWAGLSGTLGTPDYMAPEQVKGRRGDARTDLYAIGIMLYEMLTAHLPYEEGDHAALLRAKTHRAPVPPREHVRDLPASLQAIILRAIDPDPRERYATARELLADLQSPLSAPVRAGAHRRTQRRAPWTVWPRRVLLAAVGIAACVAGEAAIVRIIRPRPGVTTPSTVADRLETRGAHYP